MKSIIKLSFICLILITSVSSCKKTTKGLMPTVTGKSGEMVVLSSKALWDGIVGDSIKAIFNDIQVGMPQDEAVMDLFHLNQEAFTSMFKTHRSILEIKVSSSVKETKLVVKDNMYARTQAYMRIEAASNQELLKVLKENRTKILSYFLRSERNRKIGVMSKAPVQEIFDYLKKEKKFTLAFPSGYEIGKKEPDFFWVRKETPESSQGMFIYTYDYLSEDAFDKDAILLMRNAMLKDLVPGPSKGSYMVTEHSFPITFNHFEFLGNYAVEMRGLWKVQNDFMGGPFVNVSFLDSVNNRIICMDAYVYRPNKDKRELLRELEAVMYTYTPVDKVAKKKKK
ncbi:DUF4837 family protein [Ancylomarina euxinus]|uniref:DUF4837 family protein n=1 Tax=Ancylomarina euxinus TaxID=2283627 RepID=A0A425XYU9_9BACT|nr:DUF4837 family protein [Ancylomarina euxinus]MCZ4695643.1 DUF4837 family protein [Ancylomarina euxinus]MUP16053.1 DUF4837 family protein [Ancylomarina euxinus]RRG20297.1 DUF4837 family protein [Ancylomarina euxinus]